MKGKRIAILEARLGRELAELVAARGGLPVHAPALAEVPDLDAGAIADLVRSLEARPAALAIFQTGVGTRALFNATDGLGRKEHGRGARTEAHGGAALAQRAHRPRRRRPFHDP